MCCFLARPCCLRVCGSPRHAAYVSIGRRSCKPCISLASSSLLGFHRDVQQLGKMMQIDQARGKSAREVDFSL